MAMVSSPKLPRVSQDLAVLCRDASKLVFAISFHRKWFAFSPELEDAFFVSPFLWTYEADFGWWGNTS